MSTIGKIPPANMSCDVKLTLLQLHEPAYILNKFR